MDAPTAASGTRALDTAVVEARTRYAERRPRTGALHERAAAVLPGGNTRSVLYHPPFPLRVVRAEGATLLDADGHTAVDLLGEYSAGLYGHSHPVLLEAMTEAMREGLNRGAHSDREVRLAEAVCARFPAVERVRFTNSGTEANLMALAAARVHTGRERIVAFRGGYHGGVLSFAAGPSPVNAPYDVLLGTYNDVDGAVALVREHAHQVACVLVEPMLGSGGCIPGDPAFLHALREVTTEVGALLVLDEVMTSRTGAGGLHGRLGVVPDLVTLGKYLGGGAPLGAFGGRADVLARFDPSRPDALPHAGTFNNNVVSMAAGHAALTRVYTPERAEAHTARGDELRARLDGVLAATPFCVTGVGSLMALHPVPGPVRGPEDLTAADPRMRELLFLDLLERGWYVAPRGYVALSLALTDAHLEGFVAALADVTAERGGLWVEGAA